MPSFTPAISASKEKWLEKFARFGFVSKGIVYFLMGTLSTLAAFGLSSEKGDKSQAFHLIYEQPYGRIILLAIAAGLLGYVTLRMLQAIRDTDNKGTDMKGVLDRIGYGMSGLLYLSIAVYALKLAVAGNDGGGSDSRQLIVSKVLDLQGGHYLVGIAGAIVIGMGIYQLSRGITGRFMKRVNLVASEMKDVFKAAGTVGYVCRGIVLGIIGYFLIHAALAHNPNEAKGTSAAFDFVQSNFGSLMMAVIALGLAGYGVFCFVKAKYQRIELN